MAKKYTPEDLKEMARTLGYETLQALQAGKFGVVLLVRTPQGETAVMKKAIVSRVNFQIVHEAHVLEIIERESEKGGEGREHLPRLIDFHNPAGGAIMVMNHCGQDLGDYQMESVDRLRAARSSAVEYLSTSRKICRDLLLAVHFLSSYGQMCHHDIKFANVAVQMRGREPHATLIDFGTCYPCAAIPDSVYGTHNYHPREVHATDPSTVRVPSSELTRFLADFADPLSDMYGSELGELRARNELRFDEPRGACDTFGIGVILAEMLYGVSEKSSEGFRQWENLLFPTSLSPMTVKETVVESIDLRKHGEELAAQNLKDVMTDRCMEKELFFPIMCHALDNLGAAGLLLQLLSSSAATRISPKRASEHSFFSCTVTAPPDAGFRTPPSHAIRMKSEREFEEYNLSLTPCTMSSIDPASLPLPSSHYMSTAERFQQRNSSQPSSRHTPAPSTRQHAPQARSAVSAAAAPPPSEARSSAASGSANIPELQKRITLLQECQRRKHTQLRESTIKMLEEGVRTLKSGQPWVEPVEDDY